MSRGSHAGSRMARWADGGLVGRDDVMDQLADASAAAARGEGSIVVLAGEAGVGKTCVVRELARRVRGQLEPSWGCSSVDRNEPAFWPWRALIPPDFAAPALEIGQAIGRPRFEQLSILRDQLLTLARAGPRLHIIEDLQWADVASVLLLMHLGLEVTTAPLLVVATIRTGELFAPQLDDAIEQLRRVAHERTLEPLHARDIAAMISAGGFEPEPDLLARVVERTGGNALFVTELLRSLPTSVDDADLRLRAASDNVPALVAEIVSHRLRRLPSAVVDALVTASVIGADGDTIVLAGAHGCPVEALLDLLDQARAAHVLDDATPARWQFRHQLIRDAVYRGWSGRNALGDTPTSSRR